MGVNETQHCSNKRLCCDKKYELVVLDMDGTLYFQRKMQLLMCKEMLLYALAHPCTLWKLKAISVFRKIREESVRAGLAEHYEKTARILGKMESEVRPVIEEWMFYRPLKYIPICRDRDLCSQIEDWKKDGVKVVVYSDYPAEDKCKALGISVDGIYSSEDEGIAFMKPSVKALEIIVKDFGVSFERILVVGDRYSRDGKMAENAGVDYFILNKYKIKRKRENIIH